MSQPTVAGQVARQLCAKHPEMASRTLAKLLMQKEPILFPDLETTRASIRYIRGAVGKKNRDKSGTPELHRELGHPGDDCQVPDGDDESKPPFILPLPAKVLVMSDLHVPYHDKAAIDVAIRTGVEQGCESVYIDGDGLDNYSVSRFCKDPRKKGLKEEIDIMHRIMDVLEKKFKKRYYKFGNHESRWCNYLFTMAPAFAEIDDFKLQNVLKLEERGWGFVDDRQLAQFGHLHVLHGHEAARGISAPVNPARGAWLKIKATCLIGHFHQVSGHSESLPLDKRLVASWSMGCLCGLKPDYAPVNSWSHGFATVDVRKDGIFKCQNYRIIDGEAMPA